MKPLRSFGRQEPKKMWNFLVIACTALSLCVLSLIKARYCPAPNALNSRISVSDTLKMAIVDQEDSAPLALNSRISVGDTLKMATVDQEDSAPLEDDYDDEKAKVGGSSVVDVTKPVCDTSGKRSDTCEVEGDVRVQTNSTTIFFQVSSPPPEKQQWKIRPYPRKGSIAQAHVKEWTIQPVAREGLPACTKSHGVPAVVFSVGGFTGNLFHDFTDVLVPLFITSHRFHGDVQFIVSDTKPWWVAKFLPILNHLSKHHIIAADGDGEVHCFPRVVAGPTFHKELGVDPARTPTGYSMMDFKELLASTYGLRRRTAAGPRGTDQRRKPRLLIISRKQSRAFVNEMGMGEMARSLGYDVVVGEPGVGGGDAISRFARLVNTADVMVGVHGAGMTNMVFLPAGAVVVQVVPLGGLEWLARDSFRDPAAGMGLKYLDYSIQQEESTLADHYPADHPVLRDPMSLHKQGWHALKSVYLDKQNVRPHLGRLRATLSEALHLLPQQQQP